MTKPDNDRTVLCDVNWGTHGCDLSAGHHLDGSWCRCDCADDPPATADVGAYPYYGPETRFYGTDVGEVWGLPVPGPGDELPQLSQSPRYRKDQP